VKQVYDFKKHSDAAISSFASAVTDTIVIYSIHSFPLIITLQTSISDNHDIIGAINKLTKPNITRRRRR
jgi:hypothetical protein